MRILPSLVVLIFLSLVTACSPHYDEDYYRQEEVNKRVLELSKVIAENSIKQLIQFDENIVIINGLIIDTSNKTYGIAPKGGYYEAYKDSVSSKKYSNWNELKNQNPQLGNLSISEIKELQVSIAKSGFKEYYFDDVLKVHAFLTGSSVMLGFEGVLIGDKKPVQSIAKRENYSYLNQLNGNIYYFEFR